MGFTIPVIGVATVIFALVTWNLVLPVSSSKNADFLQYARNIITDEYKPGGSLSPLVPVMSSIEPFLSTKHELHTGPRVLADGSENPRQVTLTFYVEYGNHLELPQLVEILREYGVKKAVFFVEKSYMSARPFMIQTLEYNGYKVEAWENVGAYDREYAPTVFLGVPLIGSELLLNVQRDNNAASFLSMALHYNEASVVAFTPKIVSHRLLLDEVLKYNDKSLIFTDENRSTASNIYSPAYLTEHEEDPSYTDPVLDLAGVGSEYRDSVLIREGDWTITKLQAAYPFAITYLESRDAYVILDPLVIDSDAHLAIENVTVLLRSSTDKPATLEVRGSAVIRNSTVSSWDPATDGSDINGYHPRPYILAKNGGVINVYDSAITHLGYSLGGVSDTRYARSAISYYNTGNFEVVNSTIAFNYYGFYSDHATNFRIIGNEVYGNTRYGLDPHTGSKDFIIDSNYVHDNGNQGIICSLQCANVTITNNVVEYNIEGIGLHWLTNSSIVENNVVRYNQKYGIFIQKQSFNNTFQNNVVIGNGLGIGLLEGSSDNVVRHNTVADSRISDIYMERDSTSNVVENNSSFPVAYEVPEIIRGRIRE
ncbi:right-handed parallel beta-helix repeat-containing protein [Nitrososphaera sp.]|uniref:right-handed parallel beta-helix repeat-containing protein n=1 Tax=Nitrososphaera sp. TaxID=1971748 RepID=UPI00183AD8F7|nr:right-handed parallel beta-helix repeat-containing protein [Nitrososphaera sp.]NWG37571.1 right-handed parallel beta-helix repeat-containing protein [Nitrososphaera sp.]